MSRILRLTTPHMRGEDVRELQRALNGSAFGDFLRGAGIDGDFGVYTAQAVHRAKYWLGYAKPNKHAGAALVAHLRGRRPLNDAMQARRRRRIEARKNRPVRSKALARMRLYLGERENPMGSNRCPATRWWGWVGPWCAMQVSRAYVEAGSKAFARGSRYANVGQIVDAARAGRDGLSLTKRPVDGDLIVYRFPGCTTRYSHIGMKDGRYSLEGNTHPDGSGSQDNGGRCCRRERGSEYVRCYVHVSR